MTSDNLARLQRRWWGVTAVYLLTLLAFFLLLQRLQPSLSTRWLALALVTAVYCLWIVRRYLPENHRGSATVTEPVEVTVVLARLGWGNRLTILRGLLMSMLAGFLFSPWPGGWLAWLPALLYTTADIADFLDGYAARKTNHATVLGERLDMEFDGLGTLIVTLLAVWYAQLPWWYLLIGLARYLFLIGLWLRAKLGKPTYPLLPSWHRRIFAGFQMGFLSVVLWPIVPPTGAAITGTIFALATSASFLRDWFVVSGQIDPQSLRYLQAQRRVYRLAAVTLPPVLRVVLAGCLAALVAQTAQPNQPTAWIDLFTVWHLPWPAFWASFFAVLGLIAALMVTLGVIGRVGALLLFFPLAFLMIVNGPSPALNAAGVCTTLLLLLGTGAFSLWRPEEKYMVRRAGEGKAGE